MQWFELGALDSSANLEDARSHRLRSGLRLGAVLAIPIISSLWIAELIFGVKQSWALHAARLVLCVVWVAMGLVIGSRATSRQVSIAAVGLHTMGVAYCLLRISATGGAMSPDIALFPMMLTAATFLMPLDPRYALTMSVFYYIGSAFVCHFSSPADTPVAMVLNMHKITFISLLLSTMGSWLHYNALREMFEWRLALREESRRAALALERARIARDLHDHVGARLTGIALRAEREQKKMPPEVRDALIWIQDTIRLCLEELRDTIWALSSSGRDARELVATLRRRAEDIADAADLHLTWTMDEAVWNGRLSPGVSVALSAIMREALTNTIRHSGAKRVTVTLAKDSEHISVEITDDGIGIGATPSEGRGLNNMRSRAKEQNGEVRIEPNGTRGLRVIATIPLLSEPVQKA